MAGETTLTLDVPVTLASVTIPLHSGPITVTGQTTPMPGLVITPTVLGCPPRFTGGWQLTHQASGRVVVNNIMDAPLAYVRETAVLVRDPLVDWTASAEQIRASNAARDVVRRVYFLARDAMAEHRPLWWARNSYYLDGPGWTLRCAAPLCGQAGEQAEREPTWLTDLDDDETPIRVAATVRDDLAGPAERAHWRQHGRYWLCPTCADAHPITTPDNEGY